MRKNLIGLLSALALASPAFATSNDPNPSSMQPQSNASAAGLPTEIKGKVVGLQDTKLLIQGDTGVIPLELTQGTYFGGAGAVSDADAQERARRIFNEGEEVRASFTVQSQKNVATAVFASNNSSAPAGMTPIDNR